ncbi:hypothetical protein Avbf_18034 [Armadillidium vulgare]|nr:hypothetical protein Avbf_18034 [Armadillidium vulgare]
MRDHSIYVYRLFTSLKQNKFYWPEKKLLYGNGALNCFIEKRASRKSLKKVSVPHTEYLQRRSLNLNSNLLPDGLHGTQDFVILLINHQKMFREFWGNSTNIPPQSIQVTITAPTPAPRKSLLGDFLGDLYRQCQSPSHISVNQPVPRSSPPPDRISELLYQFGTLDQPSTSRAVISYTASNKYSLIEEWPVPGVDSNLRINSTSHCVFSDATKLNLMEGVFESSTEVKVDKPKWTNKEKNHLKRKNIVKRI